MNILKKITCIIVLNSWLLALEKQNWADINFDTSMGNNLSYFISCLYATEGNYTICTYPKPAKELYFFLRALYEKNTLSRLNVASSPKIPKIIHMIWLGKEFPTKFHAYRQSWIDKHPQWTHILWTDNVVNYKYGQPIEDISDKKQDLLDGVYAGKVLVASLKNIELYNKAFYNKAENLGEKSDILRYELLYRFGGLYVDTDFECLHPLDLLHHCYDFYTGIQPLDECLALNIALFGSSAEHPILQHCIQTIKNDQHQNHLIKRTGPVHFTKSFWATANDAQRINIAFPASFFYPVQLHQKYLTIDEKKSLIKQESFAVHHWAASWH